VNQKRLFKSLAQEARRTGRPSEDVSRVCERVRLISDICGEQTSSHQMLFRLGTTLLRGDVHIIAPACPDYSHQDGKYTFRTLGSGVSLLAEHQIAFLKRVSDILDSRFTILIADQEALDSGLQKALGLSMEDFQRRVLGSLRATQEIVQPLGWAAEAMTSFFPDLLEREEEEEEAILADSSLLPKVERDSYFRSEMYRKILGPLSTLEQFRERTLRTAAQYRAVAALAANKGLVVSNHSTTNLSWYKTAGTAVLHNAVSVY